MAIHNFDGFDALYGTNALVGGGRRGGTAFFLTGSTSIGPTIGNPLIGSDAYNLYLGFAYRQGNGGLWSQANWPVATIGNTVNAITLVSTASGGIDAYRDWSAGGGTYMGSMSGTLVSPDVYQYLQFRMKRGAAGVGGGEVELLIDGVQRLLLTGVATADGTGVLYNTRLGGPHRTGAGTTNHYQVWDDVWSTDDKTGSFPIGFLGDQMARMMLPNGAGTYTQWTPLSGANWEQVGDFDEATYITQPDPAVDGVEDTYTFAPIMDVPGTYELPALKWVMTAHCYPGEAFDLGFEVIDGGAVEVGVSRVAITSDGIRAFMGVESFINPGFPFTVAEANGMEFGPKYYDLGAVDHSVDPVVTFVGMEYLTPTPVPVFRRLYPQIIGA